MLFPHTSIELLSYSYKKVLKISKLKNVSFSIMLKIKIMKLPLIPSSLNAKARNKKIVLTNDGNYCYL